MNIPEHMKSGRELVPGQSLDMTVPVGRPGRITIFASATSRSLAVASPARYRVELFAPGSPTPVAAREVHTTGALGILEYDAKATAGLWLARVTNLNGQPLQATLEASYPGIGDLQTRNFPAHFLEAVANRLLSETSVQLHHGRNASVIRFAPALGLREFRFTLPSLRRSISPPLLPALDIQQQVNSISSNAFRLRLLPGSLANPGGTLRMEIGFEERGVELVGSFPIHMARMRLIVEMDLASLENRIAFSNVRVTFDCDANTQSLPVWICNPIFDFQERLREAVRSSVRAAFEEEETAAALANGFERGMESVLGANARVATVHMENGLLCLGLIRPVRAAVA